MNPADFGLPVPETTELGTIPAPQPKLALPVTEATHNGIRVALVGYSPAEVVEFLRGLEREEGGNG